MRLMVWTIHIEGRRKPFLVVPHTGPQSVRTVELALAGVRAAGQVAIVNFTRSTKQVDRWLTTSSA